ncbi:MAG: cupin domain-containing protein [Acetobacteraceae bacterium]|nr:cupin domain-containing protein [Acetobacteraceae bacterium]
MRTAFAAAVIFAMLVVVARSAPPVTTKDTSTASSTIPLILEKNEGEKRTWRPIEGATGPEALLGQFIFKVDRYNGGSAHLVFLTEDIPPGGAISRHRHPGSDEIIFLQSGRARVSLGDMVREVHGGATLFAPADTWIEVTNIGPDTIHGAFVFSAPGFDDFMRAESVPEGQKVTALSKTEDAKIMKEHAHAVIYEGP